MTNSNKEILVQVREDGFLDHSAAGHVKVGESYLEAATRELSEELGIKGVELKRIGHVSASEKDVNGIQTHVFDVFSCTAEPGELQSGEVKRVYWANPEEVLGEMKSPETAEKYCKCFGVSLMVYMESQKTA